MGIKNKPPLKRRKFNVGILASEGYWSFGIQKVAKKWRLKIGEKTFDDNISSLLVWCHYTVTRDEYRREHKKFLIEIALAINQIRDRWEKQIGAQNLDCLIEECITDRLFSVSKIDDYLQPTFGKYKIFILELLLAVDALWKTQNLDRWILEFGFSGDGSDYENDIPVPRSYKKIQRLIKGKHGEFFDERTIAKRAQRLKLT
jgi:hypothetical protein